MSFLDRVTKAVSDTVDRGKKEVDQYMRIQKVKGEIADAEKAIDEARARIQQVKIRMADAAIDALRAGTLTNPELSALLDQIAGVEQEIGTRETFIVAKKDEIEKIKAEDAAKAAAPAASGVTTAPPAGPPPVPAPSAAYTEPEAASSQPVVPPPLPVPPPQPAAAAPTTPTTSARVCPACGHPVGEKAAFCGECGRQL